MQDTQKSRSGALHQSSASLARAQQARCGHQQRAGTSVSGAARKALRGLPGWSLLLWVSACNSGQIGEPTALDRGLSSVSGGKVGNTPTANGTSSSAGGAGSGGSQAATSGGASSGSNSTQSCGTQPLAAATPIARLTNTEYRNTLHSLLPKLSLTDVSLPADVVVEGFDNNAKAQTPSAALIEQYAASAEAVADAVSANLDAVLPCAASAASDPEGCATKLIDSFVTRAYRRPLLADERTRYLDLFKQAQTAYGFEPAIGMLVQASLQSPHFLYRVELGDATQDLTPLDGYAMASRLSYFFWDDMPDDALLDAAASGSLGSKAGIEQQARRLLADPKARPAVASLFRQWLRFDKMDRMPKSLDAFPMWNDNVAASLRSGTQRFVEHVFWDMDGSLDALLTDTTSFVDQNTAPLYGITDQGASRLTSLTLTDTSAQQRSGILTQVGLLAAFAHETTDSPVLRGVFVMDRLLCSAPPPPPGVTGSIEDNAQTSGMTLTTRDRVALTHESGTCASCHHTIDGFGFGFSHYDAIGRWRELDNGLAVNAQGWVEGTRDANGTFDGVVELGQKLAQSAQVSDCAAQQWYRYSLGLGAKDVDSCELAPIAKAFSDSDGSLQELMIAIATSDAFRNRSEAK